MGVPYDTGFPTSNDSLGSTRDKFFNNIASIKTFVDVNHYDFSDALYGNHKWTTYGRLTSTFPDLTGTLATAIATYGASDGTRTQLWLQPSGDTDGTQAIQLTAGDVTNAAFSTNINYDPPVVGQNGGFTFLPGNLLFQYGKMTTAGSSGTLVFPIEYSAIPYSITTTSIIVSGDSLTVTVYEPFQGVSSPATTGFSWRKSGPHTNGFYWTAIGPA